MGTALAEGAIKAVAAILYGTNCPELSSPCMCSHLQHYRNSQSKWLKCVLLYQVSAGVADRTYRWSGKCRIIRTGTAYAVVKDPAD